MKNNTRYSIIDEYIKYLYKGDKSKEVVELKEEIREHLTLSADELSSKGYGNEESARMAIEKFDGGTDMLKELHSSLKNHKSILKNITKLVGLIAMICCFAVVSLVYYTESTDKKEKELSDKINKELELLTNQNLRGYGGNSFLDKEGNIAHYQYYLESYNYNQVFGMIYSFFYASVISIISYMLLKSTVLISKKCRFS